MFETSFLLYTISILSILSPYGVIAAIIVVRKHIRTMTILITSLHCYYLIISSLLSFGLPKEENSLIPIFRISFSCVSNLFNGIVILIYSYNQNLMSSVTNGWKYPLKVSGVVVIVVSRIIYLLSAILITILFPTKNFDVSMIKKDDENHIIIESNTKPSLIGSAVTAYLLLLVLGVANLPNSQSINDNLLFGSVLTTITNLLYLLNTSVKIFMVYTKIEKGKDTQTSTV